MTAINNDPVPSPKDNQRPPAAIELWQELLDRELSARLIVRVKRGAVLPMGKHMEVALNGIAYAKQFQITFQRIIIDEVINGLVRTEKALNATPWYRFALRMRLRESLTAQQAVLMIIANTPPPTVQQTSASTERKTFNDN